MDANRTLIARINARLKELGLDWPDLARELPDAYAQLVHNWKSRGSVPPQWYPSVAKVLGWSVEQLLGTEPAAAKPDWPFPAIPEERIRRLTDAEIMRLQAAIIEEMDDLEEARREKNRQRKRAS